MAAAPRFKLYSAEGEYLASSKQPELLAACIGLLGPGATIRDGRSSKKLVLWEEGSDGVAYESYDNVADLCHERKSKRFPD